MIAIGVDWEGRRNVLAVELAHRESQSSWKEFCLQLKTRGLTARDCVRPSVKFSGSRLAAVLRAFPPERARLPAAQSEQRLHDGTAVDL